MKEKTAAAYARYSTDNQTENSIEYQMHEITGYCLKNHIKLTHQFVDEGCSGTNTDRASFQRMIEAARRGEFSNIIIYDISRGSRDVADWFSFRRLMRELHVNVISCHQQLGDPLDPDAFLREFISVGLGQHMVLETRQKSLDGMDAAARKGLFLGGVTPFGFGVKDQRYFIVPSEAAIVREVFRLYADGYSYDYIMEKLDLSHVIGRHGAPMSRNSLYYMLKNARYAGIYTWNAHTYQVMRKYVGRQDNPRKTSIPSGAIPPIVDMDTFLRVQERMKKNKNRTSRPPIKKRVFLLSGLIRCARCGCNYFAHVSRVHGREYLYYCCGNRYGIRRKRYGCKSDPIRGEALEAFVIDAVKQCRHLDRREHRPRGQRPRAGGDAAQGRRKSPEPQPRRNPAHDPPARPPHHRERGRHPHGHGRIPAPRCRTKALSEESRHAKNPRKSRTFGSCVFRGRGSKT